MNEKLLDILYIKLRDGFKTNFIPRKQFESEISQTTKLIIDKLISLIKTHHKLKHSKLKKENSQIIKITKNEFILTCFNNQYSYNYNRVFNKFSKDDLDELKISRQNDYDLFSNQYDDYFEKETKGVVISVYEYIKANTTEKPFKINEDHYLKESDINTNETLKIEDLFWYYFNSNVAWNRNQSEKIEEVVNSIEKIIKKFADSYLSNRYIKLMDRVKNNLKDFAITNFDTVVINVGKRHYEIGRSGWSTNHFKVFNDFKEYEYSISSKDEKRLEGEFVNVFIHQKKNLHKLNVKNE